MIVRELITLLGFDLNDGPLKKYDKQIDSTKEKTNMMAKAARGVGIAYKVAAAAVVVGVGWISKNIINATIEMEGYRSQMQAFTGDADSAAEALASLRDKTIDPLFGTGNLVNAYKQLRTVGLDADKTSKMIDVLGDVANGSVENFNALNSVLVKVSTSGKVNEGTMRQLANAGFGVQDMAQGLGVSVGQLQSDLADGKLGFNELTQAMAGATAEGGRFYMNAAKQANTLGGSIKILKDTFSSMGDAIGAKVLPPLVSLIRYVTNLVKLGNNELVNFGAKAFDKLIHIIYQVLIFFEVMQMRIKRLGLSFDPLKKIFQDVFGLLGTLSNAAVPLLHNIAALIIAAFRPIQAFVSPVIEALKPIIKDVFGFLSRLIERLIPKVSGLTPLFGRLGQIVGGLIAPALKLALGIKAVNTALAIGKGAMTAFKTAQMGAKAVTMLFSGDLIKMRAGLMGLTGSAGIAKGLSDTFGLLTGKLSVMKAAAEGNKVALMMMNVQMAKVKVQTLATAAAQKVAALAAKAWDIGKQTAMLIAQKVALIGQKIATLAMAAAQKIAAAASTVWTGVQWALNAAMAANPIGLIVAAIVAGVALIGVAVYQIVKHWDSVKSFFIKLWGSIKSIFAKIVAFVKKNALNIVNILVTILFPLAGIMMALVRLIIKHWDVIGPALKKIWTKAVGVFKAVWGKIVQIAKSIWDGIKKAAIVVFDALKTVITFYVNTYKAIFSALVRFFTGLWSGIVSVAKSAWEGLKIFFASFIEVIKAVWTGLTEFFSGLWDGIREIAGLVWEGIKNSIIGVVDGIKNVWIGFKDFFSGLWEAIKQGPTAVVEYISNIFTNLWASITEKFMGFVNTIKEGWEKIKGFLGGVIDGAVNFVTGGGDDKKADPKSVNDLIITPEGQYSTHPDDYIMAMREPSSLMENLVRFLGQGGMQPAYAGAGGGADNSLVGNVIREKAQQNTYNNSNTNNTTQIDSNATITVNVPAGTTSEQAASIARQVDQAVKDSLSSAIGGARGTIPSPEARRL